jgi:hypothetical protein
MRLVMNRRCFAEKDLSMNPTNNQPEWACSAWSHAEHNWLDCPECLLAYEMLIEKAQEWEEDEVDTLRQVGLSDG